MSLEVMISINNIVKKILKDYLYDKYIILNDYYKLMEISDIERFDKIYKGLYNYICSEKKLLKIFKHLVDAYRVFYFGYKRLF